MNLRVLGYKEDGEWCALCLEMDLRGYGKTFEDALKELSAAVLNQFTFAIQMDNPDLLLRKAEIKYFSLYYRLRRKALADYIRGASESDQDHRLVELPVPSRDEIPSDLAYAQT